MKKILILAKSFGGGGSEVALIELLNHIDYNIYKVKVLLLDDDNQYFHRLKVQDNIIIEKIVEISLKSNGNIFEYLKFNKLSFEEELEKIYNVR